MQVVLRPRGEMLSMRTPDNVTMYLGPVLRLGLDRVSHFFKSPIKIHHSSQHFDAKYAPWGTDHLILQ